ncbi:MAG: MFS transporter [Burkholderiales bacterium]|nr:MFS transporter [Burkholderiales bacterium]
MKLPARGTAVAVLAACFVLNMLGRGIADTYAVFLVPLEREFGWTRSQLTGVYAIYLLVNGFTAPLVGMLFDRLGPRWVYGLGTACLGSAFFLAQGLSSLWQFYLLAGVMVGIAVSLNGMVPGSALLARWYRARLSTAIGIAFSAIGVGTVMFVPIAQQLVSLHGWRAAYHAFGTALLLLVPLVLFAVPWKRFAAGHAEYQARAGQAAPGEGWTPRRAMRTRIFWGLAAVFFCTATGMYSILVQLVALLIDAGYSPLAAAATFGVLGMLSSISIMSSGLVADRFGARRTVSASFAGTAAGMLLLAGITFSPSIALLVLFAAVFGLCMGTRGPIISSICARQFAGPSVATIYGTVYACNALGAAFGSLMGGVLHDLTGGYQVGLGFSLAFIALAATPFWIVPALRNYR